MSYRGEIKHARGFDKKREKELIDGLLESYQNKQFGYPNNKVLTLLLQSIMSLYKFALVSVSPEDQKWEILSYRLA